jgi:GTP-binding protein EngB required for normal cell division
VKDGIFPLAEANDNGMDRDTLEAEANSAGQMDAAIIGSLARLRQTLTPLESAQSAAPAAAHSMNLLRGVRGGGSGLSSLSSMFRGRATIHRIIGCQADLQLESRRDNIHTAEVALVGRSNVGKSSLLNALLVNGGLRRQLAQTSATPGRTQQLFMFSFEQERNLRIVDWSDSHTAHSVEQHMHRRQSFLIHLTAHLEASVGVNASGSVHLLDGKKTTSQTHSICFSSVSPVLVCHLACVPVRATATLVCPSVASRRGTC